MYRILTEDKNRELVYKILNDHVEGYTLTESIGIWKGVQEKSIALDFIGTDYATVRYVAEHIKTWNGQEAVLILTIATEHEFI